MLSQIRETRRVIRAFRDEWKRAGYSLADVLDSISIALMRRPKLIVFGVVWTLFAISNHSDNAISIAIGGTVALIVLVLAEAASVVILRAIIAEREKEARQRDDA